MPIPDPARQSCTYADRHPRLDTVSLDQSHGPALVDAEAELEAYRLLLARMEAVALAPDKSRDFIHSLVNDL